MLSVLPLAHMYEFTQGFMTPLLEGANITYLGLKPSPTLMLKALEDIKPHYILSVPLLIEKIYKNSVLQPINKSALLSKLYKVPAMRKLLNRFVIGKKLKKLFGGRLKFFGIGGAPLSDTVEQFLREAAFPYAIGYGLTETSPCLAGSAPYKTVFRAIGPAFDNVKIRVSETGEIQASGDTIMKGYFRDEELTSKVFTEDGWFKTGDLGSIDEKGNLFIKGRLKNLILGPAGENIYPEEIENILKAEPLVSECLVLKEDNGLVARVFFDDEKLKQHFEGLAANISHFNKWKEETMEALRKNLNQKLSGGSKINKIIEQETPFELTPSLKVKRFLYQKNDNLAW
jgi:long-chain acyl-CoA synthetase